VLGGVSLWQQCQSWRNDNTQMCIWRRLQEEGNFQTLML